MTATIEEQELVDEARRVGRTIKLINELSGVGVSTGVPVFYGPSRHLVARTEPGSIVAKFYKHGDRRRTELRNLATFNEIKAARTPLYREVNREVGGADVPYLGLPRTDPEILDLSSESTTKGQNGTAISVWTAIPGEQLYAKMIKGVATFKDFLLVAAQIARIQQEGKNAKERLNLEDVVWKARPQTTYFLTRFREDYLDPLMRNSGIQIQPSIQDEMTLHWETLVASNLVRAHREGFTGFYYDGNPKNHILDSAQGTVVSFDLEDRVIAPVQLSLASLMSFGVNKDGRPYLSNDDQLKILNRYLLEIEFTNAMIQGAEEKAKRIAKYVSEMHAGGNYDLSSQDEFFRFMPENSVEKGRERMEKFVATWSYAQLERHLAWLAHKSKFRAVGGILLSEGFKFEIENPVQQNAIEQREHLNRIIELLGQLKETPSRNGRYAQVAAGRLYDIFRELAVNPYFSSK
ncbi:hypothetical protein HYX00_04815 [Candidatus Woesearchaeota archaeon]|nr:hypothetical protein [Candidatus Woesearchaeota archaeon]